jgi:hypothetical protein
MMMTVTNKSTQERTIEALQRRLDEQKDLDGFECRECQFIGYGYTVLPESMMEKYASSRDCPDEVYWVVRKYDETAEELQDEYGDIDFEPEYTYENSEFLCEGHAPDCNGVCDYNILTQLRNKVEISTHVI